MRRLRSFSIHVYYAFFIYQNARHYFEVSSLSIVFDAHYSYIHICHCDNRYVGRPDLTASDHKRRAFQRQQHERFKFVSKALTMVVGVFLYLTFTIAPSYEIGFKVTSATICAIVAWFKLVRGAWAKALKWSGADGTWEAQREAQVEMKQPSLALFARGSKVMCARV